jgi:cation-dependent mannose-6-phosphate receptor
LFSVLIAVAVYLIGGCAYQRTVMHQRGWRQCPNYSMWAGLVSFISVSSVACFHQILFPFLVQLWLTGFMFTIQDFVIIIFSSLTRCFVRNRGSGSTGGSYSRVNVDGSSPSNQRGGLIGAIGGRGRGGDPRGGRTDVDAENRLIDQLDEEWED